MRNLVAETSNPIYDITKSFFSIPTSVNCCNTTIYPAWLQYVIMFVLIAMSGNKLVFQHGYLRTTIFAVAFIFAVLLLRQDGFNVSARFATVCICFWAIFVYQSVTFSFFPTITIAGFYVRLFLAYTVCRMVRDFPQTYINILFWLGIISLCFFIPEQILNAYDINIRNIFIPFRKLHLGIYYFILA